CPVPVGAVVIPSSPVWGSRRNDRAAPCRRRRRRRRRGGRDGQRRWVRRHPPQRPSGPPKTGRSGAAAEHHSLDQLVGILEWILVVLPVSLAVQVPPVATDRRGL